jgi:hypothetical protein
MRFAPSPSQLEVFKRRAARPVALLVQFSGSAPTSEQVGGRLVFAARAAQVLCGPLAKFDEVRLYEFTSGDDALAFVDALGHQEFDALQVEALSVQPRAIALLSKVLAVVMPRWPFDNATDETEEPGIGTSSVMPTREAIAELRAHPSPEVPVTMVNWLKFRPNGGRAAYHRYGKVALVTTHSIGAKLLYAARYLQTLIGNGGDPGPGRWDEFALMRYPGRSAFAHMASLKRYRRALHHREAGLAEQGQGLLVTESLD